MAAAPFHTAPRPPPRPRSCPRRAAVALDEAIASDSPREISRTLVACGLPSAAAAAARASADAEAESTTSTSVAGLLAAIEAGAAEVFEWARLVDNGEDAGAAPLVPWGSLGARSAASSADKLPRQVPEREQGAFLLLARAAAAWARGRLGECARLAEAAGACSQQAERCAETARSRGWLDADSTEAVRHPGMVAAALAWHAWARLGELGRARDVAARAAAQDPDAAAARVLPLLRAAKAAEAAKAEADALYRAADYDAARKAYEALGRPSGDEAGAGGEGSAPLVHGIATAVGNAAAAASLAGDLAAAERLARRAVSLSPFDARPWNKLGAALERQAGPRAASAAAAAFRVAAVLAGAAGTRAAAVRGAPAALVEVHSDEEWNRAARSAQARGVPVVADFSASWCGPCRILGPAFAAEAASAWPLAALIKVDIDSCPATASAAGVQSVPHVVAYVNGSAAGEVKGADTGRMKELVERAVQAGKAARAQARGHAAGWPVNEDDGALRWAAESARDAGLEEAAFFVLPA